MKSIYKKVGAISFMTAISAVELLGQGFEEPEFIGAAGVSMAVWDDFTVGFGGPNAPDVAPGEGAARLSQMVSGATVTGSGNIYNPADASVFQIVENTEGLYERVVLQVESIGDVDLASGSLTPIDGLGNPHEVIASEGVELSRVEGGFGDIVISKWEWTLDGVEADSIELSFAAEGSHLSLAVARLDTLSASEPRGEAISAAWEAPAGDRWNYPFNFTPGERSKASAFRAVEEGVGITRHGNFMIRFSTSDQVPAGLPPEAYAVESFQLRLLTSDGFEVPYDPTYDSVLTHLAEDAEGYVEDEDSGRPVEVFGAMFHEGTIDSEWSETSPYTVGEAEEVAVVAGILDEEGNLVSADLAVDFENPRESSPLAIGRMDGVEPGALMPEDAPVWFDVDPNDARAVAYLQRGFSKGFIDLVVTSLSSGGQGTRTFPEFHTKESLLGEAPSLTANVVVQDVPSTGPIIRSIEIGDEAVTLIVETEAAADQLTLEWASEISQWNEVENAVFEPAGEGRLQWSEALPSDQMRFYRVSAE